MSRQRRTDCGFVPGFFYALFLMDCLHRRLLTNYRYRVELRPRAIAGEERAVRRQDDRVYPLAQREKEDMTSVSRRLNTIDGRLDLGGESEESEDLETESLEQMMRLRLLNDRSEAVNRLDNVQQLLLRWRNKCTVCWVASRPAHHGLRGCTDRLGCHAYKEVLEIERAIYFARELVCYRCGVPKIICDQWVESNAVDKNFKRSTILKGCAFPGLVLETMYGIKQARKDVWERWLERLVSKDILHTNPDGSCKERREPLVQHLCQEAKEEQVGRELSQLGSINLVWEFE
ncbi:uncharacterized protein K452DRAFT_361918 [Aplosporella prunicola CBS 121167]|uniref:Uncharacterized protein n=1 Tax=Aplosporella prunicola CBS 121167 TaxID=1176127 RepID=A0A6A6AZN4_9PEZI|nr:uncharacterized protein K452DRAFT_361918 [Aplosporella prunicola CBS 121167]KAF2137379.1 hypothetical protein K452DRAFT_361918 [Aplosporella prunicola CBS 121167]